MNLSIAAKFGLPALALAAALVACPKTEEVVAKTTYTVVPANAATGVLETANVVLTFSAAMPDTAKSAVTLKDGTAAIAATSTWDATKKILTVDPTAALGFSKVITVAVAATKDAAGVDVDAKTTSFTVKAGTTPGQTTQSLATSVDGTIVKDIDGTLANPAAVPPVVAVPGPLFQLYPLADAPTGDDTRISFRAGNNNDDSVGRGVLRFALPAPAVASNKLAKAELTLTVYKLQGTGAFARGFFIRGVDYGPAVGADTADTKIDFEAAAANSFTGPIGADPALGSTVTVEVTAYVTAQLAAGKPIDLRAEFGTERTTATGPDSSVRFYTNDATNAAVRPVLKLTINP
jgi:Bacterial Ig-like domain